MAVDEIKVVCFNLSNEEYGLDVNEVLGVNPMMEITHIPKAPNFVEGVIRIREKVIPVIDLRKHLGIEKIDYNRKSRIIVAKVSGVKLAVIVDDVSEVISISLRNIEPPSDVLDKARFLKGVGKLEKRLLLLLDLEKMLSAKEVETLAGVRKKEKAHGKEKDISSR